jgi:hypothetical protein
VSAFLLPLLNLLTLRFFGWRSLIIYALFAALTWLTARGIARKIAPNRRLLGGYGIAGALLFYLGLDPTTSGPPVGAAFYMLIGWAYIFDLAKGRALPIDSPPQLLGSLGFFPTVLCGPIYRLVDLHSQLRLRKSFNADRFSSALLMICFGLAKKTFADFLKYDNYVFGYQQFAPMLVNDLLAFYFDFSGYSDMAIGLARAGGVDLPLNFSAPLLALSPAQFWRRWHISLGEWIRQYLYLPWLMSFPRKWSKYSWAAPMFSRGGIILSMVLFGLWHKISPGFLLWGLCNGLFIVIAGWRDDAELSVISKIGRWALTIYFLLLINVLRLTPDLITAGQKIIKLHRLQTLQEFSSPAKWGYFLLLTFGASKLELWLQARDYTCRNIWQWALFIVLFLFVALVHLRPFAPFMYMSF